MQLSKHENVADTISITFNIGNSTYPVPSTGVKQSEALDAADLSEAGDDLGWEHMRTALIAIVAGVIAFLTIVGNIMVSGSCIV